MKKTLSLLILIVSLAACKDTQTGDQQTKSAASSTENTIVYNYPNEMSSIFEAHGGIERWNKMNSLSFELASRSGAEVHTISLKNRKCKIESKEWSIGFDGEDVWLKENKENAYKGNARFYHNLMFYFYAMPFVLADNGIDYAKMEETELDGLTYDAIKISYAEGVGDSPKDEYIIYFDRDTKKMTWLGYTVTFKDNQKSTEWHFIKYSEWKDVNGLHLPVKLDWYTVEDNRPKGLKNSRTFTNISINESGYEDEVFAKPEGIEIVER